MNRIEVVRITRRLNHVWADVVNKEDQVTTCTAYL